MLVVGLLAAFSALVVGLAGLGVMLASYAGITSAAGVLIVAGGSLIVGAGLMVAAGFVARHKLAMLKRSYGELQQNVACVTSILIDNERVDS
jgi:hypothetical protein